MKLEQKEKINSYAELKIQIKELEDKIEILQPEVMAIMDESELEEVEIGELGKLSKGYRRSWEYTSNVKELEKKLKEEKKIEEQTGKAEYVEKPYLLFKTKKESPSIS